MHDTVSSKPPTGENLIPGVLGGGQMSDAFSPARLPCGRTLPNRFVKVSLYEHMASFHGSGPNEKHLALYARWARGNWGMIMTGNVQVAKNHLSLGRDMVVPEVLTTTSIEPFTRLAAAIHGNAASQGGQGVSQNPADPAFTGSRTLAIMQISHAGKQSPNILGGRRLFVPPLAPSAVALDLSPRSGGDDSRSFGRLLSTALFSLMHGLMFLTPRAMEPSDIDMVVDSFVRGAKLAVQSGFDGVELHAAHGYLIAEFISPKANVRKDEFSAISHPLQFLWRIVSAIRAPGVVPQDFALGVKLNAADYVGGGAFAQEKEASDEEDEQRVLAHVREIASWKMVDFIEVSGGTYENPKFMNASVSSRRQALFSRFSRRALADLSQTYADVRPLVLLTGGLTGPEVFAAVLRDNHADLLGIGRLSVLYPELPKLLKGGITSRADIHPNIIDELEGGPLAIGKKPWEERQDERTTSWNVRPQKAFAGLMLSLWALVPTSLRPEFPKLIGSSVEMAWYDVAMRNLAMDSEAGAGDHGGFVAIIRMWAYIAPGPFNIWPYCAAVCAVVAVMVSF